MIAERQLRQFSACVLELHQAKPGPSFVPTVLAILRRLLDADQAFFGLTDIRARQSMVGAVFPNILSMGEHGPQFDQHFDDHPFHVAPALIKPGDAFRFRDLPFRNRWERSELCNQFFRPIGAKYQMMLRLPAPSEYAYAVGLGRDSRDFSDDELALLRAFREHLLHAFTHAGLLGLQPFSAPQPPRSLRVVVDGQGRMIQSDRGAEAHLHRYFTPARAGRGERLAPELRRWLTDQISGLGNKDRHLRVARGADACHIVLLPDLERGQHELILVEEDKRNTAPARPSTSPNPQHENAVRAAAADWALTARQSAVLRLLVTGQSNKEIAAALGCAEVTVEFHVTALLRKAAASGRAALVARVLAG